MDCAAGVSCSGTDVMLCGRAAPRGEEGKRPDKGVCRYSRYSSATIGVAVGEAVGEAVGAGAWADHRRNPAVGSENPAYVQQGQQLRWAAHGWPRRPAAAVLALAASAMSDPTPPSYGYVCMQASEVIRR